MEIFEFHFNPPNKKEITTGMANFLFDSFCYQPENIYEKKLGGLYMVGALKKVLPQNIQFLEKLAKFIKEEYYKKTLSGPEKSLRESLKKANEFLEEITKSGDVSWLGNLSFVIIAGKDFNLNFTKVGDIKILLLRGKKIVDLDKKIKFRDIEPYPLKIFGNVVSGKFAEGDLILILTKEIFDFFQKENLIEKVASLDEFSINNIKKVFYEKRDSLSKISGIFLAILVKKTMLEKKRETVSVPILKEFSFYEVFSPFLRYLKPKKDSFLNKIKSPQIQIKAKLNKQIILVLVLVIVLCLGFIITRFVK
jgi:hypothetical protein